MRDLLHQAIRAILEQGRRRGTDNEGFVNYVHVSYFENLEIEYERHCKKHGIRKKPSISSRG